MEYVTLDRQRQQQARILSQLLAGKIITLDAAASLEKSVRWVERMRPAFRKEGVAALVHGNQGRSPANALAEELRTRVYDLATDTYKGFNFAPDREVERG